MSDHDHLVRMLTRLKLTAIRDQLDNLIDEAGRGDLTIREALALFCQREIARKGPALYRGFLESYDGVHWSTEHQMALVFWNYFGRRSVRTYSNSTLPGRMSKANQVAAPDRDP